MQINENKNLLNNICVYLCASVVNNVFPVFTLLMLLCEGFHRLSDAALQPAWIEFR
jgi:hypothetical protein